jgi:DNA polymerase-1
MPRLFVLDAMGLAYRAYYAFIGRPLKHVLAQAEQAGTVRLVGVATTPHQNASMATGADGVIEIESSAGVVAQRVPVPTGVYVLVDDGDRIPAGKPLIAENTSAIYGFANTVLKIRREENPDYWALAWDGPGPTHRHLSYAEYKATRKPMPADLRTQIPAIEDMAQALGLPVLEVPGVEADDVMATLAHRAQSDDVDVVLVTSDKDLLQLVNERVRLLSPVGRGEDYVWVDREQVRAKWGVEPAQIRDVLALMGDSVDNVPGVPGIGQKTASDLVARFGSIDALYERLGELGGKAVQEKLAAHRERAFLSRDLVTVKIDCDLPHEWRELNRAPIRREALRALAERYEFQRLERIASQEGVSDAEAGRASPGRDARRSGGAAEAPAPGVRVAPAEPENGNGSSAAPFGSKSSSRSTSSAPHPSLFESTESSAGSVEEEPARPAGAFAAARAQGTLDLWPGARASLEDLAGRVHAVRARATHGLALLPVVGEGRIAARAADAEDASAGDDLDSRAGRLVGLALVSRDGHGCYLPLAHEAGPNFGAEEAREWLLPLLADGSVAKVGEDLKRDAHALSTIGIPLDGMAFDLHVASFVCDPVRDHSLIGLARDFMALEIPRLESNAPESGGGRGAKRVSAAALPVETVARWAEGAAQTLFPLADRLRAQIEAREQWPLYAELELPLIPVLLEMERTGVLIDRRVLAEMSEQAAVAIARLEQDLFEMAGERFNLQSGPQLSRVLFEKLGLKAGRRTKTGYSTDQAVLEELAAAHPLPARLLEYRALTKLKSTYLDSLAAVADPHDGRVHTTFHQAGAATGRLSSSHPNLQNIPMRSPQGRAIRRAFVAPPGRLLVGADYSQIELRILAHLSGDPQLIEAFAERQDIHESTARRIFGIREGALDPVLRARAKVVNFGVIYGMGARSLSQQMGIGLAEAQEFIAQCFRVYSRVREFLDQTLDRARERGWVQTLFGRRRYLPSLADARGDVRSLAERAAINAPIQGSAADLMKIAMVRVHHALMESHPSARLLLQVHDELLLECAVEEADAVAVRVRAEMEACVPLRVPLEVSVGRGDTWFDVH